MSMRVWRRASSGDAPAFTFSATRSSMYAASSSSRSRSTASCPRRLRAAVRARVSHDMSRLECDAHRDDDTLPVARLDLELAPAGRGELVVFRAPVVLGRAPARAQSSGGLETVERGEQ